MDEDCTWSLGPGNTRGHPEHYIAGNHDRLPHAIDQTPIDRVAHPSPHPPNVPAAHVRGKRKPPIKVNV